MEAFERSRIKAICLDVDGTLSDTDDQWVDILARFAAPLQGLWPYSPVKALARRMVMDVMTPGNQLYHLLDKLNLDDDLERAIDKLSGAYDTRKEWRFTIIPGIEEALKLLSTHFPLAVVSSRGEISTRAFLRQFKLEQYFTSVVTAQTTLYTKPFPHPLLRAAQDLALEPNDLVMVGDTTVDILTAASAGSQAIGVLSGFGYRHELQAAGAQVVIESVSDLPALFDLPV